MTRRPLLALGVLLGSTLLAAQAGALSISLQQVGGTAIGGQGVIGDTVVVAIEASLDPGDAVTAIGVSLQWDQAGGDVLDIVEADEAAFNFVGGLTLTPISNSYRYGAGTDPADNQFISSGTLFPATFSGPTFVWGWEQVTLIGSGAQGPASFQIGTATFVLREVGTTTVDFALDVGPLSTLVFGQGFLDETGTVAFEEIDISTVALAGLTLHVIPEPATGTLLAAGLVVLARARRRG